MFILYILDLRRSLMESDGDYEIEGVWRDSWSSVIPCPTLPSRAPEPLTPLHLNWRCRRRHFLHPRQPPGGLETAPRRPLQAPQKDASSPPHYQSRRPQFHAHAQVLQQPRPHVFFPLNPRLRLPRVPAYSYRPFFLLLQTRHSIRHRMPPPPAQFHPAMPNSGPPTQPGI